MKNILLSSAIITTLSLFTVTQALAETAFGFTVGILKGALAEGRKKK